MLNWHDIDTVLLDMDGTLLDLSFDNYFWLNHLPEKYAQHVDISVAQASAQLETMSIDLQGSLNWYCVDYWSDKLDIDIEALKYELRHKIKFRPYTTEFLIHLKQLKKEIILVTNAHPKSLNVKVNTSGLNNHINRMVSSHEFLLAKENPGFWHKLEDRENIDLSRCLFIDDSVAVLQRAHDEGVAHTVQVLQPDMQRAPAEPGDFLSILHFDELMRSSSLGKTNG